MRDEIVGGRLCGSLLLMVLLSACHSASAPGSASGVAEEAHPADEEGVTLSAEEAGKLGIETRPAVTAAIHAEVEGYATVLSHELIAQAVADVTTAEAAVRQSHAALERIRNLANTPGAFPAESLEGAQRQAAADDAALQLARRKFSVALGLRPPWGSATQGATLSRLANGELKLVRVTFPTGTLRGAAPRELRFEPLNSGDRPESWPADAIWDAPADAAVPGRSLFALLKTDAVGEGEHLRAWAAGGESRNGVIVPRAAAVIHDGRYWCYVRVPAPAGGSAGEDAAAGKGVSASTAHGEGASASVGVGDSASAPPGERADAAAGVSANASHFRRAEIDGTRAVGDGYLAKSGITAGDAIVVAGAGLLLARETGSSEAEE